MALATFDTHELVKNLQAAGFTEDQAEAVTRAVKNAREIDLSELAAGADLAALEMNVAGMKTEIAGMKTEIAGVKTRIVGMKTKFPASRRMSRSFRQSWTISRQTTRRKRNCRTYATTSSAGCSGLRSVKPL